MVNAEKYRDLIIEIFKRRKDIMIEYKLHSEYLEINEGNNPSFSISPTTLFHKPLLAGLILSQILYHHPLFY